MGGILDAHDGGPYPLPDAAVLIQLRLLLDCL
jgi:hypothetical protein